MPTANMTQTTEKKICKKCGSEMVQRTGKFGTFWGCRGYPKCKNTENISRNSTSPSPSPSPAAPTATVAEIQESDRVWSAYQLAIFETVKDLAGHLVIKAGAGSGKTTVGVEIARRLPQALTVAFVAFNVKIARTFAGKLPNHILSCTLHSLGLQNITAAFGKVKVDGKKVNYIIRQICDGLNYDDAETVQENMSVITRLVSMLKALLLEPTNASLDMIVDRWNLEVNGDRDLIYEVAKRAFTLSLRDTKVVDFDDMIYFSATKVACRQFDVIVVDETQDLNKSNLEMVLRSIKPGGHIIAVGDENQSIYGFRGADTEAMQNMIARLNATVLPLSITYRVPLSGVRLANTLVPELEAAPNAKEGILDTISRYQFGQMVRPGDLVLCRTNAPLVSPCFELIRRGIKAVILGRDIGTSLMALVKKVQKNARVNRLDETIVALEEYCRNETAKLNAAGKEMQADNLQDRVDTIFALMDGCYTTADLERRIGEVFADDAEGVTFSTVHKSKGGEADRVFILNGEQMPHPKASADWELVQERNIAYVAYTRHREALYFVASEKKI